MRQRAAELAAEALTGLADADVPASLRRVRLWTPVGRRTRGAKLVATALESAPFRAAVAGWLRAHSPDLVRAAAAGLPLADGVGLVDAAAVARLTDAASAPDLLAALEARHEQRLQQGGDSEQLRRLEEQRDRAREAEAAARRDADAARAETDTVRRELRAAAQEARRDRAQLGAQLAEVQESLRESQAVRGSLEQQLRQATDALARARQEAESSRREQRAGKRGSDVRLAVLTDALVGAAAGLRRELALPATGETPAELYSAELAFGAGGSSGGAPTGRRLTREDGALLEQLLRLPRAHLVVDGYNVSKTGYSEVALQAQRDRLVRALAALAARTQAEVTCVFDAAEQDPGIAAATSAPRGVRVLFSPPGVLADQVIVALVHHEPPGRTVLVATNDAAVAHAVEACGARSAASDLLLVLLDRA